MNFDGSILNQYHTGGIHLSMYAYMNIVDEIPIENNSLKQQDEKINCERKEIVSKTSG